MPGQIAPYLYTSAGSPVGDDITALNPPKGAIVFDETNGIAYLKNSERGSNADYSAINGAGALTPDIKVLAASQTVDASTTLAALTGASWAVVAGGTYVFEADLAVTCTVNAGLAVGFTLTTATLTSIRYNFYVSTATDNAAAVSGTGTTATSGTKMINTKTAAYTRALITGSFVVNAGGTFALSVAQETSGTGGDVTIFLIGSTSRVQRVA